MMLLLLAEILLAFCVFGIDTVRLSKREGTDGKMCRHGWHQVAMGNLTTKCIKIVKQNISWHDASVSCHAEVGALLNNMTEITMASNISFLSLTSEDGNGPLYWIGLHVDTRVTQRLVWDGLPPRRFDQEDMNKTTGSQRHWKWDFGEPTEFGKCMAVRFLHAPQNTSSNYETRAVMSECQNNNFYICQADLSEEIIDSNRPSLKLAIQAAYQDQNVLAQIPFKTPLPVTCQFSRQLTKQEEVYFYRNGELIDSERYDYSETGLPPYQVNISVPQYDMRQNVSRSSVAEIGYYWCSVMTKLPYPFISSPSILVRYAYGDMMVFQGRATLKYEITSTVYIDFNLYGTYDTKNVNKVLSDLEGLFTFIERRRHIAFSKTRHDHIITLRHFSNNGKDVNFMLHVLSLRRVEDAVSEESAVLSAYRNELIGFRSPLYGFMSVSLWSTVNCPERKFYNGAAMQTPIEKQWFSPENCTEDNIRLVTANCKGDYHTWAYWGPEIIHDECNTTSAEMPQYTTPLTPFLETDKEQNYYVRMLTNLIADSKALTPLNLSYVADILENIAELPTINLQSVEDILDIVDKTLSVPQAVVDEAQKNGNASTRIVEAFENISAKVDLQDGQNATFVRENVAVQLWKGSNGSLPVIGLKLNSDDSEMLEYDSLVTLINETDVTFQALDIALVLPQELLKAIGAFSFFINIWTVNRCFRRDNPNASQYTLAVKTKTTDFAEKPTKDFGHIHIVTSLGGQYNWPLRKGQAQSTLFNLALAMLCSLIVFVAGISEIGDRIGCIAVAVLMHYFILVSFMWMLIEAILQYLRFVKVLGTYIPNFRWKTTVPAWGLPVIPVAIVCGIDYNLYHGGYEYCWMSLPPFYYAFAIPVGVIIFANLIVFGIVIKNLFCQSKGLRSNQSAKKRQLLNFQAALTVFILLGLTWLFGYLAIEGAKMVFKYIFCIVGSLQGFFIFIMLSARDKHIRKYLRNVFCCDSKEERKIAHKTCNNNSADIKMKHRSDSLTDISLLHPQSDPENKLSKSPEYQCLRNEST